jgi:hypothetical protein
MLLSSMSGRPVKGFARLAQLAGAVGPLRRGLGPAQLLPRIVLRRERQTSHLSHHDHIAQASYIWLLWDEAVRDWVRGVQLDGVCVRW